MHNKKILVTGGAGFIGSEFVRQITNQNNKVIVIDKLTYAGDLKRLEEVKEKFKFYKQDICKRRLIENIFYKEKPEIVVHFAAETHVDRSILNAEPFFETNVNGTRILLEIAKKIEITKFIHISSDEVYGEIERGKFNENSQLFPSSPYSVSKASADMLVKSYIRMHSIPAIIVRPSNNYGPWQYPEKLIPLIILKSLKNNKIPVYGKGKNVREWIFVSDCASAIRLILEKGKIGETYNIGSGIEKKNIAVVEEISKHLKKSPSLITFVKDRPGHDLRYSLDICKIKKELNWSPKVDFEEGIKKTVKWYQKNFHWLDEKAEYLKNYWKKVYKK